MKIQQFRKGINTLSLGLAGGRGLQKTMTKADQHNEIELNFLNHGQVLFRHGAQEMIVEKETLVLYWAAIPHQVVASQVNANLTFVSIPLSLFLSWELPDSLAIRILQGKLISLKCSKADIMTYCRINQWVDDIAARQADLLRLVELELEIFFRRLARHQNASETLSIPRGHSFAPKESYSNKVQLMVRYMTENACKPLTVPLIASRSGLTTEYAMRIFRETWGMTIWSFLIQQRISHAQRLLVTTNKKIVEIAHTCGFDSLSRFYVAFNRQCSCTPRSYRTAALAERKDA